MTCGSCGAALRADATYCGQCFGTLSASGAVTTVGVPRPVEQPLPLQKTYTRWRKTDTTFGPLGRVLWTIGVVLIGAFSIVSGDVFAIVPLCGILPWLVLRSVWAKGRLT